VVKLLRGSYRTQIVLVGSPQCYYSTRGSRAVAACPKLSATFRLVIVIATALWLHNGAQAPLGNQ
jgi:hypothetical protein